VNREDWNRRYEQAGLLWTAEPNRFLVEEAADLPPGRALDVACGEGRNAVWLAGRGWRVDAVDFSATGLDKGRRLAAERGVAVEFIEGDVTSRAYPAGAYDLVIVFYLQLERAAMRRALRNAVAALAPGGTFLLVGHDRANLDNGYGGPRDPNVLYTPEEVSAELDGLRVLEAARRRRPVETDGGEKIAIDCLVRAVRD